MMGIDSLGGSGVVSFDSPFSENLLSDKEYELIEEGRILAYQADKGVFWSDRERGEIDMTVPQEGFMRKITNREAKLFEDDAEAYDYYLWDRRENQELNILPDNNRNPVNKFFQDMSVFVKDVDADTLRSLVHKWSSEVGMHTPQVFKVNHKFLNRKQLKDDNFIYTTLGRSYLHSPHKAVFMSDTLSGKPLTNSTVHEIVHHRNRHLLGDGYSSHGPEFVRDYLSLVKDVTTPENFAHISKEARDRGLFEYSVDRPRN